MSNYYYLVAGLPSVSLDDGKLSYTVENFKSELYPSLSDKDKKLIDLFYLKFDNINLLKLLKVQRMRELMNEVTSRQKNCCF